MGRDTQSPERDNHSSSLPKSEPLEQRGYQPEGGPVNPSDLKPPHGDSAIVPPERPARKQ